MARYGIFIAIILVVIFILWYQHRAPKIDDIVKLDFDTDTGKEFLKKHNLNDSFLLEAKQLKNTDDYTKASLKALLKRYDVEV